MEGFVCSALSSPEEDVQRFFPRRSELGTPPWCFWHDRFCPIAVCDRQRAGLSLATGWDHVQVEMTSPEQTGCSNKEETHGWTQSKASISGENVFLYWRNQLIHQRSSCSLCSLFPHQVFHVLICFTGTSEVVERADAAPPPHPLTPPPPTLGP